jgi:hypothetical protein
MRGDSLVCGNWAAASRANTTNFKKSATVYYAGCAAQVRPSHDEYSNHNSGRKRGGLEPIRREQWKPLWEVAKDAAEDIFRWIPYPMQTAEDFEKWLENRRKACPRGQAAQIIFESMPAMN